MYLEEAGIFARREGLDGSCPAALYKGLIGDGDLHASCFFDIVDTKEISALMVGDKGIWFKQEVSPEFCGFVLNSADLHQGSQVDDLGRISSVFASACLGSFSIASVAQFAVISASDNHHDVRVCAELFKIAVHSRKCYFGIILVDRVYRYH